MSRGGAPGDAGPPAPGERARQFHERTKHSPERLRRLEASGFRLDWSNKPDPFKRYAEPLPRLPLERDAADVPVPALDAVSTSSVEEGTAPDLARLGWILGYGAGVLRKRADVDGRPFYFRTYACAGALYPVEAYVVSGPLAGLDAGVYHFDPRDLGLVRLRDGDLRGVLVRAAGSDDAVARAPVALVLTGIPWRTSWKYRDRGYRHLFWDSGMILANVLALAAAARVPVRVVTGFVDAEVGALLGLEERREFPLCLVALGRGDAAAPSREAPAPLSPRWPPLSREELDYPAIREVNDAGKLDDPAKVASWRHAAVKTRSGRRGPPVLGAEIPEAGAPLRAAPREALTAPRLAGALGSGASAATIRAVIRRRGSTRRFGRQPIAIETLRAILEVAHTGVPTDLAPAGQRLVETYLIANAVEGLERGAYRHTDGAFEPLRRGDLRRMAGHLCLDQTLGTEAAATLFHFVDLETALRALGDRGYRVAQLEGGIVSGKTYLAAQAYGLGATGLTFFDDEATEFFSPSAAVKSCVLVTAVGERIGRLLPLG